MMRQHHLNLFVRVESRGANNSGLSEISYLFWVIRDKYGWHSSNFLHSIFSTMLLLIFFPQYLVYSIFGRILVLVFCTSFKTAKTALCF